ncbi:MAG: hypothetical protein P8Y40_04630, partial [Desulfobacterales bacterium]
MNFNESGGLSVSTHFSSAVKGSILAEKMLAYDIDASWSLVNTPGNTFAACRDAGEGPHLFSNSVIDPLREADEWVSMHESGYRTLTEGETVEFEGDASTPLLWVLREQLGLTGTKY